MPLQFVVPRSTESANMLPSAFIASHPASVKARIRPPNRKYSLQGLFVAITDLSKLIGWYIRHKNLSQKI